MLSTERLINKVKELGFRFDREAGHVRWFKRGTQRVAINKKDVLAEPTMRSILRQCGAPEDDINEFLKACWS